MKEINKNEMIFEETELNENELEEIAGGLVDPVTGLIVAGLGYAAWLVWKNRKK